MMRFLVAAIVVSIGATSATAQGSVRYGAWTLTATQDRITDEASYLATNMRYAGGPAIFFRCLPPNASTTAKASGISFWINAPGLGQPGDRAVEVDVMYRVDQRPPVEARWVDMRWPNTMHLGGMGLEELMAWLDGESLIVRVPFGGYHTDIDFDVRGLRNLLLAFPCYSGPPL